MGRIGKETLTWEPNEKLREQLLSLIQQLAQLALIFFILNE